MSEGVYVLQHVGDLGNVQAGADGRATFRLEDTQLKVTQCFSTDTVPICTRNNDKEVNSQCTYYNPHLLLL